MSTSSSPSIRLAIADDQVLFIKGLRLLIGDFDNIELLFEAVNGQELIDKIRAADHLPDVILMDLKMPVMDGIEATKQLKASHPQIKIILLTMYDDERLINYMMEHGANGYLLKNEEPEVLREAIESVYSKDFYFKDYVSKALLKGRLANQKIEMENVSMLSQVNLTRRELEILRLICQELTTGEIAQKLYLSHRTVEGHRNNLLRKTGVRNTAGLVIFAIREKLYMPV
ncbi:MAG: response regulator transcription factor [Bacteroidota bacterium]